MKDKFQVICSVFNEDDYSIEVERIIGFPHPEVSDSYFTTKWKVQWSTNGFCYPQPVYVTTNVGKRPTYSEIVDAIALGLGRLIGAFGFANNHIVEEKE